MGLNRISFEAFWQHGVENASWILYTLRASVYDVFFPLIFDPKQMGGFYESIKSWARWFHGGKPELWIENWYGAQLNCRNAWQQLPEWLDVAIFSRSIILHAIPQLVVNCWFGARWFGYRIPLWKGFLRVSIESQTTGPQTDNYITTI